MFGDLLAQLRIVWLSLERLQQGVRVEFLLFDFLLDRCCGFLDEHLAARAGLHLSDEGIEVRRAVLQGVDEEAKQRQFLGKLLEVGLQRHIVRCGESLDVGGALFQNRNRRLVAHHGQCTDDLSQRRFQAFQIGAFVDVPEETVEYLFDVRQVVLDLPGHLADQQLFLRLA
ncbi:MAG: hypothetical protein V5B30_08500 [Candidatus Accumulibacter delftensis]